MVSIALSDVFSILIKYKNGKGFYRYWKKTATNDLHCYIRDNSLIDTRELSYDLGADFVGEFASSDTTDNVVSAKLLMEQVIQILFNPKHNFKMIDIEIYLLRYMKQLEVQEIADMFGVKYTAIRFKIQKVHKRIKNILFNSKE